MSFFNSGNSKLDNAVTGMIKFGIEGAKIGRKKGGINGAIAGAAIGSALGGLSSTVEGKYLMYIIRPKVLFRDRVADELFSTERITKWNKISNYQPLSNSKSEQLNNVDQKQSEEEKNYESPGRKI